MKKFVALFVGTPGVGPDSMDPKAIAEGMAAWGKWMADHQAVIVDGGGPLSKTKKVSKAGVEDIRNQVGGYVIVTAESLDAAARLFEAHPHFMIFPGTGVEVMEVLPIPGSP